MDAIRPKYRPEELLNQESLDPRREIEAMLILDEISIEQAIEYCMYYCMHQASTLYIPLEDRVPGRPREISFRDQLESVERLWKSLEAKREAKAAINDVLQGLPAGSAETSINEASKAPGEPSDTCKPVTWKWKTADLAWLHDTLVSHKAIECSASDFSKLFLSSDGQRISQNLTDFTRSKGPKSSSSRELLHQISEHSRTRTDGTKRDE